MPSINPPHWVLSAQQTLALDEKTIAHGSPGIGLMETAARHVADAIMLRYTPRPVVVLCGPGNNGGDGYATARILKESGWPVTVGALVPRNALHGDAATMAQRWDGDTLPLSPSLLNGAELVVDALFGISLNRPLDEALNAMIEAVAARRIPVVAVDVPSGICADTGIVEGPAFTAELTVTFTSLKPCHLLYPAKAHCGETLVVDIGVAAAEIEALQPRIFQNHPGIWAHPYPFAEADGHKYTRGHALIIGGDGTHSGAARLAAVAALRAAAGLVTLSVPEDATAVYAAHLTSVMLHASRTAEDMAERLADPRIRACLIGPGNGLEDYTRSRLRQILAQPKPAAVLDADALTLLAEEPGALPLSTPAILTPHAGEFARLFPVTGNKLADALHAAQIANAVVVYKGADTTIAAPDGRAVIQPFAPAWLATAGSGDVLAGICTGLLATGLDPFTAACQGVWLHSSAAGHLGDGMIAEDLINAIPTALRDLKPSQSRP
jgi:NAD(P)H-hydrate epimerase